MIDGILFAGACLVLGIGFMASAWALQVAQSLLVDRDRG